MRKKYVALAMGIVLSTSLFTGCVNTSTDSQSTTKTVSENTVYGQIESISDDGTITLEVGTLKEKPEMPGEKDNQSSNLPASESQTGSESQPASESQSGSDSQQEAGSQSQTDSQNQSESKSESETRVEADSQTMSVPDDSQMSILDLTGETMEITVTDDTVITRESMGGPGGSFQPPSGTQDGQDTNNQAPNGQPPSGDSDNQTQDSQDTNNQVPNGQPPSGFPNGQKPDGPPPSGAPDGQTTDDQGTDNQTSDNQNSVNQDQQTTTPPDMNNSDTQNQSQDNQTGQAADEELTISDLSEGDTISVETDDQGNVTEITVLGGGPNDAFGGPGNGSGNNQGQNGGPGQSQGVDSYTAATEYTEDTQTDGQTYESTGTDENAVLVSNGATVTLDNATVTRQSSDSTGGDNSSFYGVGAAILTTDGTTTINKADITTDAKGGAGVFAYGDGVVYVNDSKITTSQDTSGGIHVAGGGTLYASNLQVETSGESSAAIRSDRGGGTMTVDGGTYTSNGTGSPAVYTTADITVKNATLTATDSEAVCIEGRNSLTLTDVDLSGNMPENEQNDCTWNVILYQSMSGDSEEGNATFSMTGGSLTAGNGGMFYTTNTQSTFNLENVKINYADENDFFLKVTGNSNARGWGNAGENGANCTFTATDQMMEGDVIWDSISTLDMTMNGKSTLTGAILDDESNAGTGSDASNASNTETGSDTTNGVAGYCNLTISEDSTWIVTGDSTLTSLNNKGTIVDAEGKTVTIQGTDGTTYVQGNSSYTVTVDTYE